jgi:hypothetical protein
MVHLNHWATWLEFLKLYTVKKTYTRRNLYKAAVMYRTAQFSQTSARESDERNSSDRSFKRPLKWSDLDLELNKNLEVNG